MIALLDVNVLIALFDATHIHHETAHRWFAAHHDQWATCPFTESALVRILSSTAYRGQRTSLRDAVSRLTIFCSSKAHVFWTDSLSLCDPDRYAWERVQGHRQVTDAYLLALAVANGGQLTTFDSSIPIVVIRSATPRNLAIIDE